MNIQDYSIQELIRCVEKLIEHLTSDFESHWLREMNSKYLKNDEKFINSDYIIERFASGKHDYIELVICLEGTITLNVESSLNLIKKNEIFFISPGQDHCEMSEKNEPYIALWLAIYYGKIRMHLSGAEEHDIFMTSLSSFVDFEFAYALLLNALDDSSELPENIYQSNLKAMILQIIVGVYRSIKSNHLVKYSTEESGELLVYEVNNLIHEKFRSNIKLQDISQILCISANYLNALYKQSTGYTIMQYLNEYRIEEAKKILANTMESIKSISLDLGFYDQFHFSKSFKKLTGISPSEYRTKYK